MTDEIIFLEEKNKKDLKQNIIDTKPWTVLVIDDEDAKKIY